MKKVLKKILPSKIYIKLINFIRTIKNRSYSYGSFLKKGYYEFELDDISFEILLDPLNGGIDSEIYLHKNFEPEILNIIKEKSSFKKTFLDVGANIGQHTLYASHFFNHVYSFEPITKIYRQSLESINVNNFFNISFFNVGLGEKETSLPIFGFDSNMGASSLVSNIGDRIQDIKVFKLDDIYEKIGIKNCGLIKVDIEGYEYHFLLGAKKFISENKPDLLMEYSPHLYDKFDKKTKEKIITFLSEMGYKIFFVKQNSSLEEVRDLNSLYGLKQINLFCVYQ